MSMQLIMIVAIFVIFYLFLIRPQQKRAKQHQEMLKALEKGDTVYTRAGMYGRIVCLTDNVAVLEVAKVDNKGVHVRVIRDVIAGRSTPAADGGEAKDAATIRTTNQ